MRALARCPSDQVSKTVSWLAEQWDNGLCACPAEEPQPYLQQKRTAHQRLALGRVVECLGEMGALAVVAERAAGEGQGAAGEEAEGSMAVEEAGNLTRYTKHKSIERQCLPLSTISGQNKRQPTHS